MRKILFALMMMFICAGSYAQEKPKAFTWKEADLKEVGASDEQIAKILQMVSESKERIKAIKADASLSDEVKAEKVKAESKALNVARREVLTPEQFLKAKAITEERKAAIK